VTDLSDIDFHDPAVNECPYPAYDRLREEAPVWFDEKLGAYVITRYEDVREVLLDAKTFSNGHRGRPPRWDLMEEVYRRRGWVPGTSLGGLDNPEHRQLRALFNEAFSAKRVDELSPDIEETAHSLIDAMVARGTADFVADFAVPLPLHMIGRQMGGVPDEDLPKIKAWTDSWIQRRGMMMSDEELIASTELEVDAQHYFQAIFDRLRQEGDGTLLSHLVRTEVPEWGRTLTDEELHMEMMADLWTAGAESSTSAFANGMKILVERPDVWESLKADPDGVMPQFLNESMRVESPVQGLFRRVMEDVVLHGVKIPAGSLVNPRYGAANRDPRQFVNPGDVDLERANARTQIAFGQGTHACLGQHLARVELSIGFRALAQRLDRVWFLEGANDFRHRPNLVVHALQHLYIGLTPSESE
jgi:cytochrome P450